MAEINSSSACNYCPYKVDLAAVLQVILLNWNISLESVRATRYTATVSSLEQHAKILLKNRNRNTTITLS